MHPDFNTPWRLTASTIYDKPTDGKIFGAADIDVTEVETFIQKKRKEGVKVTLTHLVSIAVGKALASTTPEFNTYVKRGRIVAHPSIAASISVLLPDGSLGSVKVENMDSIPLHVLVEKVKEGISKNRKEEDGKTASAKNVLSTIPWPFRKPAYRLIKYLVIDLGISIPALGLSGQTFGSYVVSNIGTLGLETGYPSLMPMANMGLVVIIGANRKMPVVINNEVKIRKMLNISVAIDHRIADASHGGLLLKTIRNVLAKPELL